MSIFRRPDADHRAQQPSPNEPVNSNLELPHLGSPLGKEGNFKVAYADPANPDYIILRSKRQDFLEDFVPPEAWGFDGDEEKKQEMKRRVIASQKNIRDILSLLLPDMVPEVAYVTANEIKVKRIHGGTELTWSELDPAEQARFLEEFKKIGLDVIAFDMGNRNFIRQEVATEHGLETKVWYIDDIISWFYFQLLALHNSVVNQQYGYIQRHTPQFFDNLYRAHLAYRTGTNRAYRETPSVIDPEVFRTFIATELQKLRAQLANETDATQSTRPLRPERRAYLQQRLLAVRKAAQIFDEYLENLGQGDPSLFPVLDAVAFQRMRKDEYVSGEPDENAPKAFAGMTFHDGQSDADVSE